METADLIEKIRKLADSAGISVLGFAAASEFEGYKLAAPNAGTETYLTAGEDHHCCRVLYRRPRPSILGQTRCRPDQQVIPFRIFQRCGPTA